MDRITSIVLSFIVAAALAGTVALTNPVSTIQSGKTQITSTSTGNDGGVTMMSAPVGTVGE